MMIKKPDFSTVLSRDLFGLRQLANRIRQRARRGEETDHMAARFAALYNASQQKYLARKAALPVPTFAGDLPVLQAREKIADLIARHQVVIISGETGSGKTTQLPQICLALGLGARGMIAHTQPRRIAARSVAARIAEELGSPLGTTVGYQVRFEEKTSPQTVVKLMTDGMLLAETLNDKFLTQYEVIIVDEAHERSLNIDFLLGYLRRLCDKRPDLKIIITSATIDAEKFARHFNHAPMLSVSGRTYPVEIRYQPPSEDEDTGEAILRAVHELDQSILRRGDILIFLPTERDIREIADTLRAAELRDTDILPLFGRLSLAEQQAVFHPQARQRIVLATNVAETSLTVPRIKYVIDTGTARISRYSLRSKTQRLPIEAISQAAANQRAGRCGRISAGICIRLYSEEDFNARPAFTEPEILRTNLAAVILQMLTLKLGEIADFPFVDVPDQRQINDGYRLLYELSAVDAQNRLTPLGRKMAKLPIDPRFARIVFAAEKNACLHDALIILAALSIQDPRERPFGAEAQADQKQGEFAAKESDFQTWLNLFAAYQQQRHASSNNQLRKWCKSYFLNPQRMREWRELTNQLLRDCRAQHMALGDAPRPPVLAENLAAGTKGRLGYDNDNLARVHLAMLTGFIDQIGLWDEQQGDYLGLRGRRFRLFPASVLAKKRPSTVMAANITEMNQTFARTCAPVDFAEVERLAAHLVKHTYHEPHWSKRAGNVMAKKTTLLYGLPLSSGVKVPFAPQDPALAHEIFVQEALVTGNINTRLNVIADNRALLAKLEDLEHKTRSRGILVDEAAQAEFYFARLPESVHSTVTLEQWAKRHGAGKLRMREENILQAETQLSTRDYPEYLTLNGQKLPLEYHFQPGGEADGVTALIPLTALNAFHPQQFERLVPALLADKIEALLRALPKVWRRQLVPIPTFAQAVYQRLDDAPDAPLLPAIRAAVEAMNGVKIPAEALCEDNIAPHYRMNFRLLDHKKRILAEGRDLAALQAQFGDHAAAQFQRRSQSQLVENEEIHQWQWPRLPEKEKMRNGIIGYPALTASAGKIYLRLHDDPQRAQDAHREGVIALLSEKLQSKIKYLQKNLPHYTEMALFYRKIVATTTQDSDATLMNDIMLALIERVCLAEGVPRTAEDFERALTAGEKALITSGNEFGAQLYAILQQYSAVNETLRTLTVKYAKNDLNGQLRRLIYPDFIRATPPERFGALRRYLEAMRVRIHKLATDPMKDLQRQRDIAPWEERLQNLLQRERIAHLGDIPHSNAQDAVKWQHLRAYFWLLEEFRVQTFAQQLGTPVKVSAKRLEEAAAKLL